MLVQQNGRRDRTNYFTVPANCESDLFLLKSIDRLLVMSSVREKTDVNSVPEN